MVLAQPHLLLTQHEPYRCTDESKPALLDAIDRTLGIARTASHGADRTHFTVFPEYAIPAPEGIALVEDVLRRPDWPTQTIVIGGTDGLSSTDYAALAAADNTHTDSVAGGVPLGKWINCAIIWTKSADGTIERWLQPKIYPAWPEQDVSSSEMHRGNTVFVFKGNFDSGTQYRFAVLVCFDWVATVNGRRPWRYVVESLALRAANLEAELSLSWLFIIQHNRKPSHECFMSEVNDFFNQTICESVHRDRACLVFANTAGQSAPGRIEGYGNTSVIFAGPTLFAKPKCHVTFCTGGKRFRGHQLIAHHHDSLFREGGACIHSFEQVNPHSVVSGPASRTIALNNPFVHAICSSADPRTPARVVPAAIKWLNDELDTIRSLALGYPIAPLATIADTVHYKTITDLRTIPANHVEHAIALASPPVSARSPHAQHPQKPNADEWGQFERCAVVHLVHTVSILGVFFESCTVAETSVHATLSIGQRNLDVLAVRGETHEACRDHYINTSPPGRRPLLLVSRDDDNNPRLPRFGSYLEDSIDAPSAEQDFTHPDRVCWHLGYMDLLTIFQDAATVDQAKERFDAKLRP